MEARNERGFRWLTNIELSGRNPEEMIQGLFFRYFATAMQMM